MKLNKPWMLRLAGRLAARAGQIVLPTLDIKATTCDPTTDPLHPKCDQRFLYLTWHEHVVFGLPLRAHCGMLGIASEHRDGEVLNQAAATLGWKMVRGSSTHGGASALKQLLREKEHHINVAPDGPQGPRRELSQGAVYLASRSGLPIVCCAYGFDRPWRLNSWDQCVIPRPFSRVRAIYGPPLTVPKRLDRDGVDHYRGVIQSLLNRLTQEAEAWAESADSKPREFVLKSRTTPTAVARDPKRFEASLSHEAQCLVDQLDPTPRIAAAA